jgi:protoporphyrinogen oxidase
VIAIFGGGLTGLTLGYLSNKKNMNFKILEKEPECRGLMRTLQENDFTFDYDRSHIIFSKDKEVLNFILTLLGDNKIKNRRNTKIFYKGHYRKKNISVSRNNLQHRR